MSRDKHTKIKQLETEAKLLRASAATIRSKRPVEATRKEREAQTLELKISILKGEVT